MNEVGNDIPDGWIEATLGEVATISKQKMEPQGGSTIPYLSLEHIEAGSGRILGQGTAAEVKSTKAVFGRGDVLYGKLRPYLNKVCIPNFSGVCSTDILVFKESPALSNQFLSHLLSQPSVVDYATQNSQGINLPRVSFQTLSELPLNLPPLAEQNRIAAAIKKLKDRSLAARRALDAAGPLLEQFRQSVLAAAFRGDLTADWRAAHPNTEPASALLARIRTERRRRWEHSELTKMKVKGKRPTDDKWKHRYEEPDQLDDSDQPALPPGWCWATVDQISEFVTSGSRGWGDHYSATGPLFIRSQNINTDRLVLDDIAHVIPPKGSESESERARARRGDLLITITGANVTKAALVEASLDEAYVSQHVALVRPVDLSISHMLYLWTVSPSHGRKKLLDDAYGGGKPGLNLENIRSMVIAVPPMDEQSEINRVMSITEQRLAVLKSCVDQISDDLARIDQSILAKAFRGELVPQDPTDEPACELISRIRAARDAEQPERMRRQSNIKKTDHGLRRADLHSNSVATRAVTPSVLDRAFKGET